MRGGRGEPGIGRDSSRLRPSALCAFALLGVLGGIAARPAEIGWTVVLSGDADGLLAPCGCTSPQEGGLKRRATALRRGGDERRVLLDNGGLSGGTGAQHVMKAETAAQALDLAGIDAANFGAADARLGAGEALQLVRLAGRRLVSTSLEPNEAVSIDPWRVAGPFLVGGATARPDLLGAGFREAAVSPAEAAHRLIQEASGRGLAPALLFDGDLAAARSLAREEPALRLVTYRATGRPPAELQKEGDCALATPGEHGKTLVQLAWTGGAFVSSTIESLGPALKDDPEAESLYKTYLSRIAKAGLLEKAPHVSPNGFAGNEKCMSCHAEAAKVWRASGHAHALATLERVGHQKDPDCVPCHVVGTARGEEEPKMAFWSRAQTPSLANVGCESCHGAGKAHATSPWKARLPKLVGDRACLPCHTVENSPEFDFANYWPKIRHGMGGTKPRHP